MEKKVFKSIEEEEQDFQNMLNQAAQIKSYQMSLERKQFDKLPDFYKEGLYNYSSLKNIYHQSYAIKKYTYESIKHQGILYLNSKQYENSLEKFIKCICIFKYIICSNPKWASGGGIKDSELTYITDTGNNPSEQKEINQMIKNALLNISLVYLILKDYSNVIKACDEVLKIESNNVKALYRKAKAYIDDPKSLMDEYIQAEKLLELALKIKPNNLEIKNTLEQFSKKLNDDKKKENRVYKNYYHRINKDINNNINNNDIEKKMKNEEDIGVAQIRMMNLILEMCHKQKNEFERNGMEKEVKQYEKIMKQAKKYRDDLNELLEMDFNKPNEKLINLSRKEGFDLKDKNIQKYFNDLKMKLINEINEFHDNNLNLMKGKNKENKENKNIETNNKGMKDKFFEEDFIYNKNNINDIYQRNKGKDKNNNLKNTKNKNDKKIKIDNNNNNNEQLKHTIKLAISGILVFLMFYLIKILLGYYLRNKLNIDI